MKTIGVISDLHLGDGSKTDDFVINEDALIEFFTKLLSEVSVVVIAGDLFDCWQPKTWDKQVDQFRKISSRRYRFISFLDEMISKGKVIYLNGNHDDVVRTRGLLKGVLSKYVLEYSDRKILFEHGHLGDKANSGSLSVLGKAVTWIIGWLERTGWVDADKDFSRLEKMVLPSGGSDNNLDSYAKQKLEEGYDLVVLGHTHTALVKDINQKMYCNTGCFMENPTDVTFITIHDNGVIKTVQKRVNIK